jgi:hypothetical protein
MEGLFEFAIGCIPDFTAKLLLLADLINVDIVAAITTSEIAMIP